MTGINFANIWEKIILLATDFGFKIIGAIALWIVGGMLVDLACKLVKRGIIWYVDQCCSFKTSTPAQCVAWHWLLNWTARQTLNTRLW